MTKQKKLDSLRMKSKELWLNFVHTTDTKKATQLLKKRTLTMTKVHELQDVINFLFLNEVQDDNQVYFSQETLLPIGRNELQGETALCV